MGGAQGDNEEALMPNITFIPQVMGREASQLAVLLLFHLKLSSMLFGNHQKKMGHVSFLSIPIAHYAYYYLRIYHISKILK